jgi:hypothetical protein
MTASFRVIHANWKMLPIKYQGRETASGRSVCFDIPRTTLNSSYFLRSSPIVRARISPCFGSLHAFRVNLNQSVHQLRRAPSMNVYPD